MVLNVPPNHHSQSAISKEYIALHEVKYQKKSFYSRAMLKSVNVSLIVAIITEYMVMDVSSK
jgi:hypothetical protein